MSLDEDLKRFSNDKDFRGQGPLCVALFVTERAREAGLPLDAETLIAKSGTQVKGLGGNAISKILTRNRIAQVLAAEGGRTSRGSIQKMREYVSFLNALSPPPNLKAVEEFWIERVRDFFAEKPLHAALDSSKSLESVITGLISQAEARQSQTQGTNYAGAVVQHLVGGTLELRLGKEKVAHHGFTTADSPGARHGDFEIGDTVLHATTRPAEALIKKCQDNIGSGKRPIIVTTRVHLARELAEGAGARDRIDVFALDQFVAQELFWLPEFNPGKRVERLRELLSCYNEIVSRCESDPSLRIEL